MQLKINGKRYELHEIDPATPLLWVLRDTLGLVGTKFGCGIGQCGACTVLADGKPVRSCTLPLSAVNELDVTTIEGLADADGSLSEIQQAWIDLDVAQCGYCQAGQMMSATALLSVDANPSDSDIDEAMAGNLCRCGTYRRIRVAIQLAATRGREAKKSEDPS
jgi:aerobic-type carbon monoxide dehydrogenase small subunit (CoxS/CutS family)